MAAARSFLSQFLQQDNSLLDYLYDKCCNSGEAFLTSRKLVLELLAFAFDNCNSAYIILDGIDECGSREERKFTTEWFRQLVEDLPPSNPDRFRCLMVSQDDGLAKNDFAGLTSIKIRAEDIKDDLVEFCCAQSAIVQMRFHLSDQRISEIEKNVLQSVGSKFRKGQKYISLC
jgi:hypothetical protein